MKYKENFSETKEYFRAFWAKEVLDRPLIAVTCPKDPEHRTPPVPYLAGSKDGKHREALEKQEQYFQSMEYGIGEAIPVFDCSFGPDQYAGFFGAELEIRDTMSWARPCIEDFEAFPVRIDRSKQAIYPRLLQYLSDAAEYAEGKFLVNMPDLHSNLDALSAMRSPEELCVDLLENDSQVERVLTEVNRHYPMIIEDMMRAGHFDRTGTIGWAPTYCEGKFATVQCDFACMIGPDLAKRFMIPALRLETDALDHCVYHYDGKEALRHLDEILAIEAIDVIQWVPGAGNPRTLEWMDLLKQIQAAGKGLWIYDWTVDEIKEHFRELRPEGLIFQVEAKDRREAEDLVRYVKQHM